jgi:acyl-CoA reductase-like NAD-dependent aldehyde dehydrogenase
MRLDLIVRTLIESRVEAARAGIGNAIVTAGYVLTEVQDALVRVQHDVGSVLVFFGTLLAALGTELSTGNPLTKAPLVFEYLRTRYRNWYDTLDEIDKVIVYGLLTFSIYVAFAMLMPRIVPYFIGAEHILAPVPLPQVTEVTDDEQASTFPERDTKPLLVDRSKFDGKTIEAINPATGELLGHVPADDPESVARKIRVARRFQSPWAGTSADDRRSVLRVLKAYIIEEQHDICAISAADTGKTLLDASLGEIITTLEKINWLLAEGEKALTPEQRLTGSLTSHKIAMVDYDPLGVIGAIAPWNYPFHNMLNPALAALFAGNAIVIKPSEHTVYSSVYFGRIIRRALKLCGHSPEIVQVLVGGPDVGASLVEGNIDKLFFTGSTGVGRQVAQAAAKRLLPVVLELGGKDPCIICDDADIEHATDTCLRGVFQNSGQNCIGIERVFVHKDVKVQVVERFVKAAKAIRLGVDMGALTLGTSAVAKVKELVDDAVANGAKILVGGKAGKVEGKFAGGSFFEATVLDGVRPDMRIAQEEVFGPVMSIIEWSNDVSLIGMVNSCKFGLGSSIFTRNTSRADEFLGSLRVGMGNVNDFGVNYLCQSLPFGGTKESGSDRFAGAEGLRACCLVKSVTRDRYRLIKTKLPAHFKYPVTENAFDFSAAVTTAVFENAGLTRLDSFRNLIVMYFSRTWKPRTSGSY